MRRRRNPGGVGAALAEGIAPLLPIIALVGGGYYLYKKYMAPKDEDQGESEAEYEERLRQWSAGAAAQQGPVVGGGGQTQGGGASGAY